jgi:hypothetical protein
VTVSHTTAPVGTFRETLSNLYGIFAKRNRVVEFTNHHYDVQGRKVLTVDHALFRVQYFRGTEYFFDSLCSAGRRIIEREDSFAMEGSLVRCEACSTLWLEAGSSREISAR